ncbi:large subunit ribosomal protein L18 [Nitrosomonas marina]|uniref:Large ribosomal subunit protein uL18 n=1 Tax=Nitrosomonas marina TaxID=917 RepID=A0A1I0EWP2_9PROT|nr:50S ribosomal protein L18 [Nitrosomonas marina]SET49885.1 large subunit ribosomal protein L18 [Nitrosomonas marina]
MRTFKNKRLRKARQTRVRIANQGKLRLSVHRTNQHIYAQLIDDEKMQTITSASTLESEVKNSINQGGNSKAATLVGKRIAEKAIKLGVEQIAFDRSGYKYHGRVKALAESARENGLKF